ncbi:hypothetical protein RHSIM_Rhsim06G0209400 [Rhododendron simsii]|uniref:Protein kinase domain-containing protein n=1 Tax=Rhododendron simsii TaxID=118357 RepID=A0A834LIB2_RHOSS|nr:hypothetical protein RHSIM_Rhsim06G0209400 [Rhododendron simsii]
MKFWNENLLKQPKRHRFFFERFKQLKSIKTREILVQHPKSAFARFCSGTIGYLAPEMCKGLHISVKADIYSFGVVILETICGRKNVDESMPLVDIVQTMAEEDQLYNLIDDRDEDIWLHKEEAIKILKIGLWCLQTVYQWS